MEKYRFEEPSIERKDEAIEYIEEHHKYNSNINGSGGLDRYIDNYEEWLVKLEKDINMFPNEQKVPAKTYFLIRCSDNKIIGMINIRLTLNEKLKSHGGHIGYGIRPTERKKGYNKINLYLGLKVCSEHGIDKVLLDADIENPASWKTMEALGGRRIGTYIDVDDNTECVKYEIDVEKSLQEKEPIYEEIINDQAKK